MASLAEIRRLERLADTAWPAAVVEEHDGWLLRWAEGPWYRTNSVAPVEAGTAPPAAKIDHAERWYRERHRTPVFKLHPAARPEGLEELLVGRGYAAGFSVSVQTRPARRFPDAGVALDPAAAAHWLEAKREIAGVGSERARHLPMLLRRIASPAAFALAGDDGGRPAAVGLAVLTGDHVGIFDVAVHPERRRRGLATRVVDALTSWGAELGASVAYLQVETGNLPAAALYERMGFVERYRYWYRSGEHVR
jgi:ribosomal protein S18 acetylase RimI-like enzyme